MLQNRVSASYGGENQNYFMAIITLKSKLWRYSDVTAPKDGKTKPSPFTVTNGRIIEMSFVLKFQCQCMLAKALQLKY